MVDAVSGATIAEPRFIGGAFQPFLVDPGGVWFVSETHEGEPRLAHLDAATLEEDATIPLPVEEVTVLVGDPVAGTIWVGDFDRALVRIDY